MQKQSIYSAITAIEEKNLQSFERNRIHFGLSKEQFLQTLFSSYSLFQPHRSIIRNSALTKTHLLFIQAKQHVVFLKTTRYLPQNNTLFSTKRHVTFIKTTRRLKKNKCKAFFLIEKRNCEPFDSKSFLIDQSAYLNTPCYARTRTHTLQGFFVFCCHKCHTTKISHYISMKQGTARNNSR